MRIIAGEFRSRRLNTVETNSTRPTTDKNRESIFNMINRYINSETKVLDLYAGSGALGLEAISRGAKSAVLSDISEDAIKVIDENIKTLNLDNMTEVYKGSYSKILKNLDRFNVNFNLIFLDPPYKLDVVNKNLEYIKEHCLLEENGIVVCETSKDYIVDVDGYDIMNEKKYGITKITILKNTSN